MATYRYAPTMDWDEPSAIVNGCATHSVIVQRAGESPFPVSVPPGNTAREWAEILHGFDGYSVLGFGYGPDDEHPRDCLMCANGEAGRHNYEPGGSHA